MSDLCSSDLLVHEFIQLGFVRLQWKPPLKRANRTQIPNRFAVKTKTRRSTGRRCSEERAASPSGRYRHQRTARRRAIALPAAEESGAPKRHTPMRSEERRGGKACESTCRSRWAP